MIDANIQLFIGPIGKMGIGADVGASNIGLLMQMFKCSLARLEKWASVQIFKIYWLDGKNWHLCKCWHIEVDERLAGCMLLRCFITGVFGAVRGHIFDK